jgi:hypothetical protein
VEEALGQPVPSVEWAAESEKRRSPLASRVHKLFLTTIILHRSGRAIFERRDTTSAEGLRRNEPHRTFATLAGYQYAVTLYVVKQGFFVRVADVPEAKIIFVNQHLSAPLDETTRLELDRVCESLYPI